MKKYYTIILLVAMTLVFSGCLDGKQREESSQKQNENINVKEKENIVPEDKMEFSDPGDDEMGKEVKELDELMNQTGPSDYNEEDLSEKIIEEDVELQ